MNGAGFSDLNAFLVKPKPKVYIRRFFVSKITDTQKENKNQIISKSPETINPLLHGIIQYLWELCNQNPHDSGLISITSTKSHFNSPRNVLDINFKSYFYTDDEPDAFLKIDFKNYRVRLTSYVIQTNLTGTGGWHMRSWIVECSLNDEEWIILDENRACEVLNGTSRCNSFNIANCPWLRFLRIKMTEKNHWGDGSLLLAHLELHGEIEDLLTNQKVTR